MEYLWEKELFGSTDETTSQARNRKFRRFIFFLVLLVALSSSVIGYLIGRIVSLDYFTGQVIDTINIEFGKYIKPTTPVQVYQINISGIVQYSDGTPYVNGTIELRSEPRYTTTDSFGRFEFLDVEEGQHIISVMDGTRVLASTTVYFRMEAFINVKQIVRLDTGGYLIRIPLEVQVLNVILELDRNAILMGAENAMIVRLPYEVTIPTNPEVPTNPVDPDNPGGSIDPEEPTDPEDPDIPGGSIEPEDPTVPTTPTDPPIVNPPPPPPPPVPETPKPEFSVTDEYALGRFWNNTTSVDIFGERAGNHGVQTIGGQKVIAPGSYGKFIFKVMNSNDFEIDITIDLHESDANLPNIPMIYRLKRGVTGENFVGGNAWRDATAITEFMTMNPNSESYYTLEWEWDASNNSKDTAIGNQLTLPLYILDIIILAQ